VVHGIPSDYVLKEGDIVSIDCGVIMNGYYGDSAYTFPVGEIDEEIERLLEYTRASLEEGVKEAVAGNRCCSVKSRKWWLFSRKGTCWPRTGKKITRISGSAKLWKKRNRTENAKRTGYMYRTYD
jgi:hypothetical protein